MYYFNYLRKFILNNIVKDEIRVNQMGELNKWLKFVWIVYVNETCCVLFIVVLWRPDLELPSRIIVSNI